MSSRRTRAQQPHLPSPGPRRGWLLAGAVGLVIIAAAALAIVATQTPGGGGSSQPGRDVSDSPGDSHRLPVLSDGGSDAAVGRPMPELAGVTADGLPIAISPDGTARIILFLAHWCPHCQREVPVVQDWLDAGGVPPGVELVSVSTAIDPTRPNYPPRDWLDREGWTAPVVYDWTNAIAQRYGLSAFPFWVLLDAQGRVVERASGEVDIERLRAWATSFAADSATSSPDGTTDIGSE